MGTTTNYKWPYPEPSDPPNVPLHMQTALRAADLSLKTVDDAARRVNASVYNTSGVSVPSGQAADTAVKWQAAQYASGGPWWSSGSEWLTAPVAGVYQVTAGVHYQQGAATGWKTAELYVQDGASTFRQRWIVVPSVAFFQDVVAVWEGKVAAGARFKLVTNQTTGAALTATADMTARLVGA